MARILVVEDESDIRELISFTLTFSGFEVISATNGEEALELAAEDSFDLILLDVRMPRLSGYDTCRQMRKMKRCKDTPIVFLSAKGQEHDMQAGLAAGADQYILKPFAPAELVLEIKEILAERTVEGSG
jgi:DNA-binding response OmpR family regulator